MAEELELRDRLPQRRPERDLRDLSAKALRVLRLYSTGYYTQREVAAIVQMDVHSVQAIVSSTLGQRKIAELQSVLDLQCIDVNRELKELAPLATELLHEVITNKGVDVKDRLRAAKEILDRSGFPAVKVLEHTPRVGDAEITAIKDRAKRNAIEMGLVVEAQVIEESALRSEE